MAISDVCKFELKSTVDQRQKVTGGSRRAAIDAVAGELGLLAETVRTMDRRATAQLKPEQVIQVEVVHEDRTPRDIQVQVVQEDRPEKLVKPWVQIEPTKIKRPRAKDGTHRGGARPGAGRPAVVKREAIPLDILGDGTIGRRMSDNEMFTQIRQLRAKDPERENQQVQYMLLAYLNVLGIKEG